MNDNNLNRIYEMTQQEAADRLGMSRPNLGSIEARALVKLRKELEKRGYKMEDFIGGMQ
jgi:DNA-directed RNA polymerase specialized sigma24 family protein